MLNLKEIEELFKDEFNVLNGMPNYLSLDQIKEVSVYMDNDFKKKMKQVIDFGQLNDLRKINILLKRNFDSFLHYQTVLERSGFIHHASIIQFTRRLNNLKDEPFHFDSKSLADSIISEEEFMQVWSRCMLNTDNQPSELNIKDHMGAVKSELGSHWRESCILFLRKEQPIGISLPHIEPGTINEGRLFYFGMVPEERGKGIGAMLHRKSLVLLKEMGADYYIGSTHKTNIKMQRIFLKNDCLIESYNETYSFNYIEFTNEQA